MKVNLVNLSIFLDIIEIYIAYLYFDSILTSFRIFPEYFVLRYLVVQKQFLFWIQIKNGYAICDWKSLRRLDYNRIEFI